MSMIVPNNDVCIEFKDIFDGLSNACNEKETFVSSSSVAKCMYFFDSVR